MTGKVYHMSLQTQGPESCSAAPVWSCSWCDLIDSVWNIYVQLRTNICVHKSYKFNRSTCVVQSYNESPTLSLTQFPVVSLAGCIEKTARSRRFSVGKEFSKINSTVCSVKFHGFSDNDSNQAIEGLTGQVLWKAGGKAGTWTDGGAALGKDMVRAYGWQFQRCLTVSSKQIHGYWMILVKSPWKGRKIIVG